MSCPGTGPVREHYLRPNYLPDTLADQQEWPLRRQGRLGVPDDTTARSSDGTDQQQQLEPGPLMGLPVSRAERRRTRHSFVNTMLVPPPPPVRTAVSMGAVEAATLGHGVEDSFRFLPGPVPCFPDDGSCSDSSEDQGTDGLEECDGSNPGETDCCLYPLLSGSFSMAELAPVPEVEVAVEAAEAKECDAREASGEGCSHSPRTDLGLADGDGRQPRPRSRRRTSKAVGPYQASGALSLAQEHSVHDDEEHDVAASYGELLMYPLHDTDALECSPTQPLARVGPLLWSSQQQQQQGGRQAAAWQEAVTETGDALCADVENSRGSDEVQAGATARTSAAAVPLVLHAKQLGSAQHPIEILSEDERDECDAGSNNAEEVAARQSGLPGRAVANARATSRRVVSGLRRVRH